MSSSLTERERLLLRLREEAEAREALVRDTLHAARCYRRACLVERESRESRGGLVCRSHQANRRNWADELSRLILRAVATGLTLELRRPDDGDRT